MADQQHLENLFKGSTYWDEWRLQHPEIHPDLSQAFLTSVEIKGTPLSRPYGRVFLPHIDFSHADLSGIRLNYASLTGTNFYCAHLQDADLSGADLSYADLRGATLSHALLYSANFTHANLTDADLSNAHLNKANLGGANLSGANLSGADLSGAVLNATTLTNVTLDEATIGWTLFANVDLSSVRGLETLKHEGPSSVGFDTFLRSRGNLPTSFLYQTGLDQTMIEVLQRQLKQSMPVPACSLGYTLVDHAFARRLQTSIQATGAPCWLVARDIPPGTPRPTAAAGFIDRYDLLILILSASALESEEIQEEVKTALAMEAERHEQILFPICIDTAALFATQEWVLHLRENRPFSNFTDWQEEESYQKAFHHLLQLLKV